MKKFNSNADVCVMKIIRTMLLRRGEGVTGDPIRIIIQYWSLDGVLLAEVDPCNNAEYKQWTK
jgi:hypothetical protein